jgi:predicted peptidase
MGAVTRTFVQWGQDDVLRVKGETMTHYPIDPGSRFLAGASMGGYGAYAVGLHDPGQWTAVAPICGRTDFYLWFKLKREEVPAWKRALYDADDPRFLARNMGSTPFYTQHGSLDMTVPVEHSRLFAADAKALKLPFLLPGAARWRPLVRFSNQSR